MVDNNYIPNYTSSNLKWYERNGLFTYIDQLKREKFLENSDENFKKTRVINFDIIHRQARGEKIPQEKLKNYQTIKNERVKLYPQKTKDKFLASAFRSERKGVYFEKSVIDGTLKNNGKY